MTHRRTLELRIILKNHVNMTNCPASICRTLEKFHVTIWTMYLISHCANIDLLTERKNMEQLIYELSFFGMIVILIGLRLWGDKK